MKNENEQTNIAKIVGRVVKGPQKSHQIEGESFYELVLEVKRLSDTYDYIPVTISERVIENQREILEGDEIGVEGEFRSYNKLENEKSKLILHVFAKEVYTQDEIDDLNETNFVNITGYVCKEPVYRVTPFKREICDVLMAVNRRNNKSDYLPCIFWGRNAKYMQSQPVGTKINIEGRIQSRTYLKKLDDGTTEEKTAYEISVSKLRQVEQDEENSSKADAYKEFLENNSTYQPNVIQE